jgi:dCMP deaminase
MRKLVFLNILNKFLNTLSKHLNLNWDEWLLAIALIVAQKSKDPSSKVGSVIVTDDYRPVSFGFNGFVSKCDECLMTYERTMKYHLINHAEMNSLVFAQRDLKNCKMYITHGPCDNCLKHVMQTGISQIVYFDAGIIKERGTEAQKEAIRRLLESRPDISCYNINGKSYLEELGKL